MTLFQSGRDRRWTIVLAIFFAAAFILSRDLCAQEETYTFDISKYEKKPYHFGAYLEARPVLYWFDRNAALYRLRYYGEDTGKTLEEANFKVELEAGYEKEFFGAYLKTHSDYQLTELSDQESSDLYEGYLTLKPSSNLRVDAGKKTFKWGKGYAWNPAAFIDRPKDPDDPELSREGFIALSADYVRSFDGPLKTLAATPVLVPVTGDINRDFGEKDHINIAGKLYFLYYDTDIDLMFLSGASKTARFGADFSKNIETNWEIHGEWAYIKNFERRFIDSDGNMHVEEYNARSFLLGTRYLTARETTYIIEYYHNGTGYEKNELEDYFQFINAGYQQFLATGNDAQLKRAQSLTPNTHGRINPMRDYLYVRIMQKDPFDILYFTPALTGIVNLGDGSFQVSPEMVYTRYKNLELRLKAGFIVGGAETEYGEKPFDYRLEFRAGYYF